METADRHFLPSPAASDAARGAAGPQRILTGRKKTRPQGFDPNRARKERAGELRALQASAKALNARLEALQAVGSGQSEELRAVQARRHDQEKELQVWDELRQSQLALRLEAETENARLKSALEEARRLADALQRAAIKSSRGLTLHGVAANLGSKVHSLLLDFEADAKMFEMMLKEVDASYDEAPEVFRVNGLFQSSNEPRFGVQMHEHEHGRFMDMFSENILPFAVEDTSRVVWEFYSGPAKHLGQVYFKTAKAIHSSHETVAERFTIEHHAMSTQRDFGIWQVLRRHVEDHRVLVVWIGIALPVENSHKPTSSIGYCQKGYVQCEPLGQGMGQTASAFTRLRRCHRITPYVLPGTEHNLTDRDKREISAIMEWNLSLDFIRSHLQHFENQLLEESLRRQKQNS